MYGATVWYLLAQCQDGHPTPYRSVRIDKPFFIEAIADSAYNKGLTHDAL